MIGVNLQINVYERSLTTTPGGVICDDLGWRMESYQHSSTATYGYESMSVTLGMTVDEAALWMERLLCPVIVTGPDAVVCWEGYISQVSYQVGGRQRSAGIDALRNRVTVRYQTYLGTTGATASASDATSQALYGVHDAVISTGKPCDLATAQNLRDAYLARYAMPRQQPSSELRLGDGSGSDGCAVTITCAGWYATLDFVTLGRADDTTEASTAQVATLISGSSPGVGATNAFLATTATISGTGYTTPRRINADTTYRSAIETLLSYGDNATPPQRFAWGIYEDRRLVVNVWAGATPTVTGYQTQYATGLITNAGGVPIDYWHVRPDAVVVDADMLPASPSITADGADRFYIERVTFSADSSGLTLTLEPEASSALEARIARLGG